MVRASLLLLALAGVVAAPTPAQRYQPPQHTRALPLYGDATEEQLSKLADDGVQVERDRDAAWALAEHRRLDRALAGLQPQRVGVVDAYVVVAGLDSDPVFGREARAAAAVLARRYDAVGRTIVLAGSDGSAPSDLPRGSPDNLAAALARVAELMDVREDVLVLYTSSHGAPAGIFYDDGDRGIAGIAPRRLRGTLAQLGIANRLLILSACYSGVFVPALRSDTTAILTAASATRSSFGCEADNDWTFFGDALVNHALRRPQLLAAAAAEAQASIAAWEKQGKLKPSQPQVAIGAGAAHWLTALEARMPRTATAPTGRPAASLLDAMRRGR